MDNRWGKDYSKNTVEEDIELLGYIAMSFRGACKNHRDKKIILCGEAINSYEEDYAKAVNRLIKSGQWDEAPSPEDQLPNDMMPKAFFDYWNLEKKPDKPIQYESQLVDIVIGVAFFLAIIGGLVFFIPRLFLK